LLVYLHELIVYVLYFFQVLKPITNDHQTIKSDHKRSLVILLI
jgi:hypothetical protein